MKKPKIELITAYGEYQFKPTALAEVLIGYLQKKHDIKDVFLVHKDGLFWSKDHYIPAGYAARAVEKSSEYSVHTHYVNLGKPKPAAKKALQTISLLRDIR